VPIRRRNLFVNGEILEDSIALLGLIAYYRHVIMDLLHGRRLQKMTVELFFGYYVRAQKHGNRERCQSEPFAEGRVDEYRPDGILGALLNALHDARIEAGSGFNLFTNAQRTEEFFVIFEKIQFPRASAAGLEMPTNPVSACLTFQQTF
jgi:hypothetical protein